MSIVVNQLSELVRPSPRFQRAIHLRYDLGDPYAIERYIPTASAVDAVGTIFRNSHPEFTQRAHVLYAAYGSGKSLLAVVLAALLDNASHLSGSLDAVLDKINGIDRRVSEAILRHIDGQQRLLPVVLSGDEGDFATAMSRALARALKEAGLPEIQLNTRYEDALQAIQTWAENYPDTLNRFIALLETNHSATLSELQDALAAHSSDAFQVFEQLYPELTAGVKFNQYSHQSPDVLFRDAASQLGHHGYAGLVVLWDEFGRYLEGRTAQVFGREAEMLQSFAETCNHSGSEQIHFLVFAHKELQSYASALPKAYQQEWSRIEGRFQRHNVSGDPYIAYRLIGNSIDHTSPDLVHNLLPDVLVNRLVNQAVDSHLFGILPLEDVRELIYQTYPLHPLSVFCLTRLSNRVAQNERTMFTFLTTDEPKALMGLIQEIDLTSEEYFIRPASLWDYFEDAIRSDAGVGGAHKIWSGVAQALQKVADYDDLGKAVVKSLGVLTICADSNTARPTTDLLCWAVGAETDEQRAAVTLTLENLRRRKAIINRKIDGYWTFTIGSDIDFERYIAETLERTNPNNLQLRRILEKELPPPYTLARRYNQERAMVRYFTGIYRWSDELDGAIWDAQINKLDNADGLIVYVLAHDELALQQAQQAVVAHPRVVYVIPHKPLIALYDLLRELFGLHELNNDPHLKQQDDPARVQLEMDWLLEDAKMRLQREIESLIEPRKTASSWVISNGRGVEIKNITTPGESTRIVSSICEQVFSATPIFNSEGLNKRSPTAQQMNAAAKVIDAIFAQETSNSTFGLTGNGPEVVAFKTMLQLTGVLQTVDGETYEIKRPSESFNLALYQLWGVIEDYFVSCTNAPKTLEPLLDDLVSEPYGVRLGVLPILLGAVLKSRLKVVILRHEGKAQHPITGELLIEAIKYPKQYTFEFGHWDETLERLWGALYQRFSNYIHDNEQSQQPITMLRLAMTRWLQSLPAFCRETQKLSKEALAFRNSIRRLHTEPSKVLFQELPALLNNKKSDTQRAIESQLEALISEISNAYLELQRRLDLSTVEEFAFAGAAPDGQTILKTWLHEIEAKRNRDLGELRFGSTMAQQFVDTITRSEAGASQFLDDISVAITGIHLRDWSDKAEEKFYSVLKSCRADVEREVEELLQEEAVVAISVQLPGATSSDFRFRASDLSPHGKRILQNFKSQMEIAGRPLSIDEKRQIAVAFLYYMMGQEIDE